MQRDVRTGPAEAQRDKVESGGHRRPQEKVALEMSLGT